MLVADLVHLLMRILRDALLLIFGFALLGELTFLLLTYLLKPR